MSGLGCPLSCAHSTSKFSPARLNAINSPHRKRSTPASSTMIALEGRTGFCSSSRSLREGKSSLGCRRRLQETVRSRPLRCLPSQSQAPSTRSGLEPVLEKVSAFAPATVANLGPGYDWFGCAVEGDGDVVTARAIPGEPGKVVIAGIVGDNGRLPLVAEENCVGIAALEALKMMGNVTCGVELFLEKGLPLGSGMGSSAASAGAGACAVNLLFGSPLTENQLVLAGLQSEASVSGYHADNIAPAILGGFILITSTDPLELHRLSFPGDLWFTLVTPKFEAPTAQMRAVLPTEIPMADFINNSSMGGALVAGILNGDAKLFGSSLNSDVVVEPVRGPLIPGFMQVKEAALKAGAFGCTIGGAGPTTVAVVSDKSQGEEVAAAMCEAYKKHGQLEIQKSQVVQLDHRGARKFEK
ncbi:hypothetical protein BSKO_07480 [Bryopsis sp. KO-2023]|nr:hypothetical protein BSKO_07480 [Bryopsis sp. KO-2023]